jgi:hypothetical protein
VYIPSPHFEKDLHQDGYDHEAFLVTTRPVTEGEELLWSYSVTQTHRKIAPDPVKTFSVCASKPDCAQQLAPEFDQAQVHDFTTSPLKKKPSAPSKSTPIQMFKPTAPLETSLKRTLLKPAPPVKRCRGCLCVNPCSNMKHCLTPQIDLKKRVPVSKQLN